MTECENLDGHCGASWCNCDEIRKRIAAGVPVKHRRQYTPEPMDATKLVWAKINKLKAIPGNCVGCGYPNERAATHKTCKKCCQRASSRQKRIIEARAKVMQGEVPEKLEAALKMIYQLKIEMSRLREVVMKIKNHRAVIWRQGYRAGIRLGTKRGVKAAVRFQERIDAAGREETFGEITKQELSTINHAYDNER